MKHEFDPTKSPASDRVLHKTRGTLASDRQDIRKLLGHQGPENTLKCYTVIGENLALDRWRAYLAGKMSQQINDLGK